MTEHHPTGPAPPPASNVLSSLLPRRHCPQSPRGDCPSPLLSPPRLAAIPPLISSYGDQSELVKRESDLGAPVKTLPLLLALRVKSEVSIAAQRPSCLLNHLVCWGGVPPPSLSPPLGQSHHTPGAVSSKAFVSVESPNMLGRGTPSFSEPASGSVPSRAGHGLLQGLRVC